MNHLLEISKSNPILIFVGVCDLCNDFVKFVITQDFEGHCPKEQILATVDNPFKLFELYQKNIKEKNLKFSKETMAYIAELEDKYLKK